MLQRLAVHVQNLSRACHVSLSVLQTATDVTSLKLAAIFAKVGRERHSQTVGFGIAAFDDAVLRYSRGDLVGQVFGCDLVAIGHDYGPINRVLQCAYIAGPVVFHESPERALAE